MAEEKLKFMALMALIVIAYGVPSQGEVSTVEKMQNTVKAMETMLEKQQKRLIAGFDGMKKRVHVLERMMDKTKKEIERNTSIICPFASAPEHGRVLGAHRRTIGDFAYYVCDADYRLVGNEERICFENGTWSGSTPICQSVFPIIENRFIRITDCSFRSSFAKTCTCPIGFQISQDQSKCIDVDECLDIYEGDRVMRIADCQYKCRNQPGSYECVCPPGYIARPDRRCQDQDECQEGTHKCISQQQCINTFGGYQCVTTECPAQYIRTGERTCQKIPCRDDDEECRNLPLSIMYYYMAVRPNMEIPSKIFRLSTDFRDGRSTTRFAVLPGNDSVYFTTRRIDRRTGWLILLRRPAGPATLQVEFEAREYGRTGQRTMTHLAKIVLYVSKYSY